jgi:hypothetical protein
MNRTPAAHTGGTSETTTRIAAQVLPQIAEINRKAAM